ncbi:uncharacterized protein LOC113352527 [Papaver somniferum]|uniref:uncharacterized protein LOC113352527 n=1 Tax=Papaver somniferum TaxID=3469 RepID=UPI000E70446D|nr:uncharacterized protein LOC113352527 [Papaver somniferum]
MKPSNEEGVPRLLRWIISDVSNTIEKDLNDAMKKMQPGWVKDYTDEERLLLDEYRKKKQENNVDVVKKKLRISDMRRKELDEELTEVLDRQEMLLSFIEEKILKVNEVGLMSLTEREGSKGGDMHDHENDKEGSKGGDDEHGTESERNEVPSETPENQSTPSPKTNEANEEEDGKDGTSQGFESETGNKPSTLLPKEVEIPEGQEEHMNLNDQDTAQTDEIDKVAGCEAANKQSTSMPTDKDKCNQ